MNLKPLLLLIICIAACHCHAFAQLQNSNWFFASQNGISFSGGSPVSLNRGRVTANEGGASISDKNGQLLFYTDGITVWNKDHGTMPSGTFLNGGYGSATQSSVIFPKPGTTQQFYLFTATQEAYPEGLQYNLIDMSLDGGRGDLVQKNIPLNTPIGEKVTAILHCNKKDYWVVTHEIGSNAFYSWLVTNAGVSATPVISYTGLTTPKNEYYVMAGYLRASPDGKHLVAAEASLGIDLCDFNNQTGVVSNAVEIFHNANGLHYGLEFSANSQKLYVGVSNYWDDVKIQRTTGVFQFDLSLPTIAGIISSKFLLFTYEQPHELGSLVRAPNNKIYISHYRGDYLSVINAPENAGAAASYTDFGFLLPSTGSYGLPNFPNAYPDQQAEFVISPTSVCTGSTVTVNYGGAISNLKWVFDEPSSGALNYAYTPVASHIYSTTGKHTIQLILITPCGSDTLYKRLDVATASVNLGNDTSICAQAQFTINLNSSGYSYSWQDGAVSANRSITAPGLYWVDATRLDIGCVVRDSVLVKQLPSPVVWLGNDTALCTGQSLLLDAGNPGAVVLWNDNGNAQMKTVNGPGKYTVAVTAGGCTTKDDLVVSAIQQPAFSLGPDQVFCPDNPVVLQPGVKDAAYLWQDGSTAENFSVIQTGLYFVSVQNQCGITSDSILFVKGDCRVSVPNAFSPNRDGNNDVFRMRGVESVTSFSMQVYNRWGQTVFTTTDKSKGWDGTSNGKDVPMGAYIYYIQYKTNSNNLPQVLKGTLLLVR